jgi:hypothetical protein
MKDPEHDDLWTLLGRARSSEPSPFFTAKVLRAVRQAREQRKAFWRNWLRFGLPGAAAGAFAVFLALFSSPHSHLRKAPVTPVMVAQNDPSDAEVIENLDYNLASQESSVWLDSSAR